MRASGKTSIFLEFMANLMGRTSWLFRSARLPRSLAAHGRKRQGVAVAVCVSSAGWLLTRIDKLAFVNFHVAAHHFVQSCRSNCYVLNETYLKCFVIELSCFKCDTYAMQEYGVTENCGISVTLVASAMGSGSCG